MMPFYICSSNTKSTVGVHGQNVQFCSHLTAESDQSSARQ
uniref:Uncharacterized protein n=1 Tax=Anguilla anguilla TaxID=7936 RepID=A0A0E9VS33_ANGAN